MDPVVPSQKGKYFLKRHEIETLVEVVGAIHENTDTDGKVDNLDEVIAYLTERKNSLVKDSVLDDNTLKNYYNHVAEEVALRSFSCLPLMNSTSVGHDSSLGSMDDADALDAGLAVLHLRQSTQPPQPTSVIQPAQPAFSQNEETLSSAPTVPPPNEIETKKPTRPPMHILFDVLNKAMDVDVDAIEPDEIDLFGCYRSLPKLTVPPGTMGAEGPMRNIEVLSWDDKVELLATLIKDLAWNPHGHIEPELGPGGVALAEYCLQQSPGAQ